MKFLDLVAQISEVDGAARVAAGRSLQQILQAPAECGLPGSMRQTSAESSAVLNFHDLRSQSVTSRQVTRGGPATMEVQDHGF